MKLPDLLQEHKVDPAEFLDRVIQHCGWVEAGGYTSAPKLPHNYIFLAFPWAKQPEDLDFWPDISNKWRAILQEGTDRWPELEVALGWIGPLEIELRMVGNG